LTTLTKVFIVIIAVLAIVFSILVIQYTAMTENYKAQADQNLTRATAAEQELKGQASLSAIAQAHQSQVLRDMESQIAELRTQLATQTSELATERNKLLAEQQKGAALTGQVSQLSGMFQTADTERKQLQEQLTAIRQQLAALQGENFQVTQTNQELELQRQLYEKQIRLLKEQNVSLEETVAKLRQRMASPPGQDQARTAGSQGPVGSAQEAQAAPIMGQITEVRDSLAGISVGSAQGVKEGMEFIVYRGGQYLGKLQVREVQPDASVGELVQVQGAIHRGDNVTDRF